MKTALVASVLILLGCGAIYFATQRQSQVQQNYYTGNYNVSLNLYSFNVNINAWVKGRKGAPPLTTFEAIRWAHDAGFNAVNIPMYYIIGYSADSMPTETVENITSFIAQVKSTAAQYGLTICGTGIGNDFANPDPNFVALEVKRALFWIDMAAEMGAPFMRVFSGLVPSDIDSMGGWEGVAHSRVVPALKTITEHAATKKVKIGLQNHGDMTATAEQTLQIVKWVDNPNILVVCDTGYFRPFQAPDGKNYPWYDEINKVLPDSLDIQVKLKPGGAEEPEFMDYHKLFIGVRSSPYRQFINLERLWGKDDPDNPKDQPTPPFREVEEFLKLVEVGLNATRVGPLQGWWKNLF